MLTAAVSAGGFFSSDFLAEPGAPCLGRLLSGAAGAAAESSSAVAI